MVKVKNIFMMITFGVLLAACSGEAYDRAYTASGDGMREVELTADEQFTPTEDLNLVVKLNRRDGEVDVRARFIDPNGDLLEEVSAEADEDVGTVVLGLDFQSRNDQVNQWLSGRYTIELFLDDEQVDTLFFRVD